MQTTELKKAIELAEESVEQLQKSHVRAYTRQDGTAVQEHDDSRQAADKATRRAYLATNIAVKTNDPLHHKVAAKAHKRAAGHHAGTPREAEHLEIAKNHEQRAKSGEDHEADMDAADKPVRQFKKGDKVKDQYGNHHEVMEQRGNSVKTYQSGNDTIHSSKLWPVK